MSNNLTQKGLRETLYKLLGKELSNFNLDKVIINEIDIRNNYFDTPFNVDYTSTIMKMKPYSKTLTVVIQVPIAQYTRELGNSYGCGKLIKAVKLEGRELLKKIITHLSTLDNIKLNCVSLDDCKEQFIGYETVGRITAISTVEYDVVEMNIDIYKEWNMEKMSTTQEKEFREGIKEQYEKDKLLGIVNKMYYF